MDQYCTACKCLGLINDGNDFLSIHNGGSDDSEMVAKFTGEIKNANISIQGNQMFLVFHTNKKIIRKGFHAEIIESKFNTNNDIVKRGFKASIMESK